MDPLNLQRTWFYFRLGHGNYLSLAIGMANFVTIQYVLFLQRFPFFTWLSLWSFTLLFISGYGVLAILSGWLHKRKQLAVETVVSIIQNPYTYQITPGKEAEVLYPIVELGLKTNKLLLSHLGLLDEEIETEMDRLLVKIGRLRRGEWITAA